MIKSLMLWTSSSKPLAKTFEALSRKVLGTTLVETLISMTLLLTILTLSFLALDRINKSVNPGALYMAHLVTNEFLIREDLLIGELEDYKVEAFKVRKKITHLKNGMFLVELTVLNGSGQEIYKRKFMKSDAIIL